MPWQDSFWDGRAKPEHDHFWDSFEVVDIDGAGAVGDRLRSLRSDYRVRVHRRGVANDGPRNSAREVL